MMKIKQLKENSYIINGIIFKATSYKDAIKEYLLIAHSGAHPIFSARK